MTYILNEANGTPIAAVRVVDGKAFNEEQMRSLNDLAEYYCQSLTEIAVTDVTSSEAVETWIREMNQDFPTKTNEDDEDQTTTTEVTG